MCKNGQNCDLIKSFNNKLLKCNKYKYYLKNSINCLLFFQ